MSRHPRETSFSPAPAEPQSAVAIYAARRGWRLGRRNLLLEGLNDVGHFELAADLYHSKHGFHLLDDDFRVVAAGFGNEGGVTGVIREFLKLWGRMDVDEGLPRQHRIRLIPVFDDDGAGRECFAKLTDPDMPFRPYKHAFLLKRAYPPIPLGSPTYLDELKTANARWAGLDCEVEDLLAQGMLDAFCKDNPKALRCDPEHREHGHHYEMHPEYKARVLRYAKELGVLDDLAGAVRTLQYFRGLFGLPGGPQAM